MLYEDFISGKLDASNHRHDLGSHATQPPVSSSSSKAGKVENITQIMWPSLYLGKPLEESPLHQKAQSMAKALLGADMAFDFDMLISKVRYNGLHIRQTTGSFRSWVNTNIRIILDPSVRASHYLWKSPKLFSMENTEKLPTLRYGNWFSVLRKSREISSSNVECCKMRLSKKCQTEMYKTEFAKHKKFSC